MEPIGVCYISSLARRACAVERWCWSHGCETHPGGRLGHREAIGVDREVTNGREPSMKKGRFSRSASVRAVTRSERRVGLENASCGSRPSVRKGKATSHELRQPGSCGSAGAMTMARHKGIDTATREIRCGDRCWDDRPDSCEGMTGPHRKSERLVVPLKRGNARGGKGSHFPRSIQRGEGQESDASL